MGYDLTSISGRYHQWKVLGWWHLLNLAVQYGWVPAGTVAPEEYAASEPWDGNYYQNAGQTVTTADASGLADALQRMLEDAMREAKARQLVRHMEQALSDDDTAGDVNPRDMLRYPLEFIRAVVEHSGSAPMRPWAFDEKSNRYLRDFIDLCRQGAFRIE